MDEARLKRLEYAADRIEISDCLTRFSRGMDRFDRELYLSAFWPDAEMAAGPYVGDVPGCWDWAVPMHEAGQILTHHSLLNQTVDIDGDTAHSECYYIFVGRNRDESMWMAGGRYIDRMERRGDEWRIVRAMRPHCLQHPVQRGVAAMLVIDVNRRQNVEIACRQAGRQPRYQALAQVFHVAIRRAGPIPLR